MKRRSVSQRLIGSIRSILAEADLAEREKRRANMIVRTRNHNVSDLNEACLVYLADMLLPRTYYTQELRAMLTPRTAYALLSFELGYFELSNRLHHPLVYSWWGPKLTEQLFQASVLYPDGRVYDNLAGWFTAQLLTHCIYEFELFGECEDGINFEGRREEYTLSKEEIIAEDWYSEEFELFLALSVRAHQQHDTPLFAISTNRRGAVNLDPTPQLVCVSFVEEERYEDD